MEPLDPGFVEAVESPEGAFQSALALLAGEGAEGQEGAGLDILAILKGYATRLRCNKSTITYEEKKARLSDIKKTAKKLRHLLDGIEQECLYELWETGQRLPAPAKWNRPEPNLWRLCEIVIPALCWAAPRPLDWDKNGVTKNDVIPVLARRVEALEKIATKALDSLAPRRGHGAKPFNAEGPSAALWLVNECWTLMKGYGQEPSTTPEGAFDRLVVYLVELVESPGRRAKSKLREIRFVVPLRNQLETLEQRFESLWREKAHLPLIPDDPELLTVAREIGALCRGSQGLFKADGRVLLLDQTKSPDKFGILFQAVKQPKRNDGLT